MAWLGDQVSIWGKDAHHRPGLRALHQHHRHPQPTPWWHRCPDWPCSGNCIFCDEDHKRKHIQQCYLMCPHKKRKERKNTQKRTNKQKETTKYQEPPVQDHLRTGWHADSTVAGWRGWINGSKNSCFVHICKCLLVFLVFVSLVFLWWWNLHASVHADGLGQVALDIWLVVSFSRVCFWMFFFLFLFLCLCVGFSCFALFLCWWNLRACLLADDFGQTVFLGCV